jgi:glycosyltransferase involved in cell wall biosynthesis
MSQASLVVEFTKLISIITVVRNAEGSIGSTIDSVAQSKTSDVEYIVVDGASEDATVRIIMENSGVIDHWISEPDEGLYDAMNKGISLASGGWLYFLNAGDRLRPHMLSALLEQLEQATQSGVEPARIVTGRVNMVDALGKSLGYTHPNRVVSEGDLLKGNCIAHQATLISSELFQKYGRYSKQYRVMGDYDYWLHMLRVGETFQFCSLIVADFVANGISSRRSSFPLTKLEQIDILIRYGYVKRVTGRLRYVLAMMIYYLKSFIRLLLGPKLSSKISNARTQRT